MVMSKRKNASTCIQELDGSAEWNLDVVTTWYINFQLTIRGSGKLKQTITKLLALPGGKNLHYQEQWGWHRADEIVTSIPTRLKFQNSN